MAGSRSKSIEKISCPVCGMDVDENSEFTASIQGQTFYFCSEEDKNEFQQHPIKYLKEQAA